MTPKTAQNGSDHGRTVVKRGPYRPREECNREGASYDEIALELGVTRQRVMQIERAALRKLREAAEALLIIRSL